MTLEGIEACNRLAVLQCSSPLASLPANIELKLHDGFDGSSRITSRSEPTIRRPRQQQAIETVRLGSHSPQQAQTTGTKSELNRLQQSSNQRKPTNLPSAYSQPAGKTGDLSAHSPPKAAESFGPSIDWTPLTSRHSKYCHTDDGPNRFSFSSRTATAASTLHASLSEAHHRRETQPETPRRAPDPPRPPPNLSPDNLDPLTELHALLSRLRAPPAPTTASGTATGATPAAGGAATSAPTPSNHHVNDPTSTISIHAPRAGAKTLPDMNRGTADQEAEMAELEARIARQRAVLEGLRSKGLDFAAARGQAGDKMEE
ncbi:RNA polymerase II transcription mediator complex subunit 9-domain-containing protein [Apiospora aurea]|uniref:RNA polymerase II transcription mediator complex subunit 9-domain-containing protein n=1 Tax=Apiospora aurea TaxID=335848 RepID=A0ABR1PSD8_9PEZI